MSFAKLSAVSRIISRVGFSRASRPSSSGAAMRQISDSEQTAGPFDPVQAVDNSGSVPSLSSTIPPSEQAVQQTVLSGRLNSTVGGNSGSRENIMKRSWIFKRSSQSQTNQSLSKIVVASGGTAEGPNENPRPLPPQPSQRLSQPSGSGMGPAFLTSITALQEMMAAAAAPRGANANRYRAFPSASWPQVASNFQLKMCFLTLYLVVY